jgi:hypothetical protein
MRLRVFGKHSDDKGTQLEQLTRRLLERLGYRQVALNVVGSGGSEIDVRAEYPVPGLLESSPIRLVGECKAYETPINLPDWLKFLGKVYSEEARRPGQVRGLLVALSGANGNVLGAVDELRLHKDTVDVVTGERLTSLALQEFGVPRPGERSAIRAEVYDRARHGVLARILRRPSVLDFAVRKFIIRCIGGYPTGCDAFG